MTWGTAIDLVRALAWPLAIAFLGYRLTLPVEVDE